MAHRQKSFEEVKQELTPKSYHNNYLTPEGIGIPEGDNNKFTTIALKVFQLPKVDLNDPEQVRHNISEYFRIYAEADVKPSVAGLANCLGIDRRRLWEIKTGNFGNTGGEITRLCRDSTDLIKKAYTILEENWENSMGAGRINPVSGIFLGKNNFGYTDKQEYVVTPNTKQEEDYSEEDIRKRYLTEGES